MTKEILLLGNPKLYEASTAILPEELPQITDIVEDLHDTLMAFRAQYKAGRAIAAPQIGVQKRLLYMHIDKPVVFINPTIEPLGDEMVEIMDDCMSFPNLLVRVMRYARCKITYRDMDWVQHEMVLDGDLSELLQHEYDHLDGVLATMRAVDEKALYMKQ